MKRRTRKPSKRLRQSRRKTLRRFFRRFFKKGGANLPVPEGSVVGVNLDPKDNYSVPVFMNKAQFENQIEKD
jgi:hypothetical protein